MSWQKKKMLTDREFDWADTPVPNPVLSISSTDPNNTIVLNAGGDEMLRVAQDGFYVRGVKVAQDDKEAILVYNSFKEWLVWASLTRNY